MTLLTPNPVHYSLFTSTLTDCIRLRPHYSYPMCALSMGYFVKQWTLIHTDQGETNGSPQTWLWTRPNGTADTQFYDLSSSISLPRSKFGYWYDYILNNIQLIYRWWSLQPEHMCNSPKMRFNPNAVSTWPTSSQCNLFAFKNDNFARCMCGFICI